MKTPARTTARAFQGGRSTLVLAVLAFSPMACVRQGTYDRALDDLAAERAAHEAGLDQWNVERAELTAERRRLMREMRDIGGSLDETRDSLEVARGETYRLESVLRNERDDRERLEASLRTQSDESMRLVERLRALSRIEAEVRQRNRIYTDVIETFQSLIDAGQLSVAIVDGRMVIQLPQDVLFQSGSATLNQAGRSTIAEVGDALAQIPERRFQVEGHTDNVPISTQRFASNWELSSARAITVLRLLLERGVAPVNVSAAGFGEHQPIADNTTVDGRRTNRRIEITMLPNLNVIADVTVPN